MTTGEEMRKNRAERIAKATAEEAIESQKNLSVREMLEERVKNEIITIDIPNGKTTIPLKFRKLSKKELDIVLDSQRALGLAGADKNKAEGEADKLFSILEGKADGLEGMLGVDAAYWKSGEGFSADVITMILVSLTAESVNPSEEYITRIRNFRKI